MTSLFINFSWIDISTWEWWAETCQAKELPGSISSRAHSSCGTLIHAEYQVKQSKRNLQSICRCFQHVDYRWACTSISTRYMMQWHQSPQCWILCVPPCCVYALSCGMCIFWMHATVKQMKIVAHEMIASVTMPILLKGCLLIQFDSSSFPIAHSSNVLCSWQCNRVRCKIQFQCLLVITCVLYKGFCFLLSLEEESSTLNEISCGNTLPNGWLFVICEWWLPTLC